jgi:hypothetical protein
MRKDSNHRLLLTLLGHLYPKVSWLICYLSCFDARCKVMTNAFPSFGLLNFYSQGITHVWRMVARKLQILKMVLSTTVMMRYITGCFSASRAGGTFN